ncbi:MAG: chemotaxis response regulator protein-glutamate methylesterase [Deltaproteobacteria bacterium]|jgi:two-component system chemotaxis response regulator CheB|nr:chemotaxis response regulator protein-glutamate methylesterase [Deltaproteobacteria bacterium]
MKHRILVVDDSVVSRRMLSDALAASTDLELAGLAANGKIALAKLDQAKPDLVILDVEMPELDGLGTLRELRIRHPKLPVIMYSSLTRRGAATTMEALSAGANDYAAKPEITDQRPAARQIQEDLLPKIRALLGVRAPLATSDLLPRTILPLATPTPVELVVIGASTGGPNALAELIPMLPSDFPLPVVIVQHMPPVFTRLLAERLSSRTRLKVVEAIEPGPALPGHIYVAPGDHHLEVTRLQGRPYLLVNDGPPQNSCRPSVDVLFRSAAREFGSSVLAVVLTGMGKDGLLGAAALHQRGARVIVQNEASSVVWGMPGYVAEAGLAEVQLGPVELGKEIASRVGNRAEGRRHA